MPVLLESRHDAADAEIRIGEVAGPIRHWGFLAHPDLPDRPGPAWLLVAIRPAPTLRHFDPEAVDYWVTTHGRGTRRTLTHATPMPLSDDFSWGQHVTYPKDVRQMPAREALRTFRREVVLCSWPPPGNPFERLVFQARHVRRYIVIGSRERAAASNWQAYEEQEAFERWEEPRLSRLVLPPEVAPVVHVFDRREQHGPPPRAEE